MTMPASSNAPGSASPGATVHCILIIEDEDALLRTLADRLVMEGFEVVTAPNGEEGLLRARERRPDLILCDIMMPGMDGYAVLKALQAEKGTAEIPFIFMSARADPGQVRTGMGLGADDYLCKPVTKADLLAAIRTRLAKHRQQHLRLEQEVEAARLEVARKLPRELMIPLSTLLSASQLIEAVTPIQAIAEIRQLGWVMRSASQRLHRAIRRFLLYVDLSTASRRPEDQVRLRGAEAIPCAGLTAELARYLARQDTRLPDLELELEDVDLTITPSHLGEIVAELVDNALKHSASGSPVRVRLRLEADAVLRLEVEDRGGGMTPDQVRQCGGSTRFDADQWAQTGTGLGLVLVRHLATLYGGTFEIQSEPGSGTCATVRLPDGRAGNRASLVLDPQVTRQVTLVLGFGRRL